MCRYHTEVNKLADEHWPKNIVIVTHMFGVTRAMALAQGERASRADYCGYVEISRTSKQNYDWTKLSYSGIHLKMPCAIL